MPSLASSSVASLARSLYASLLRSTERLARSVDQVGSRPRSLPPSSVPPTAPAAAFAGRSNLLTRALSSFEFADPANARLFDERAGPHLLKDGRLNRDLISQSVREAFQFHRASEKETQRAIDDAFRTLRTLSKIARSVERLPLASVSERSAAARQGLSTAAPPAAADWERHAAQSAAAATAATAAAAARRNISKARTGVYSLSGTRSESAAYSDTGAEAAAPQAPTETSQPAHKSVSITEGCEITATAVQSINEGKYRRVEYSITIHNKSSDDPIVLEDRLWRIFNDGKLADVVQGDGVVGRHPYLRKGESFQYESYVPVPGKCKTAWMDGHFTMRSDSGKRFCARIAPFFVHPMADQS